MELPDGMVAVVRGLEDSALCVSLLDGNRQYTLMPNAAVPHKVHSPATHVQSTQKTEIIQHSSENQGRSCDSSAQAVDGRYASMYKMAHCNDAPTSPPVTLTEFPPQKSELCPGHGNFEVGGTGSGESSFIPTRVIGSYRGGMCWPDRGSVCNPRPTHSPDAFANSLRKYPSMSPERSAEIVERLINYTQLKNTKNLKNSPTRSECSTQHCDRPSRCRQYEPETMSPEESPTDRRKYDETDYRRAYGRGYDVRCMRDISRRVKEGIRNVSTYPYSHPVCPTIKERYDHLPPEQKHLAELNVTNSVNMETQAAIPMASKEVATVPKVQPSTKNVAVPLSPSSSNSDAKPEGPNRIHSSSKSIQTTKALDLKPKKLKSVQTCFSSVDIKETKKVKNQRKSKSQEDLRINDDFEEEIVRLIQNLTLCTDVDTEDVIRRRLLRKLRKVHKADRNERVKFKIARCIKDQLYSEIDFKDFTRELSNELISKIKRHNMFIGNNSTNVYRADLHSFRMNHEENCVDEIIKEWLNDIPFKSVDYLGRDVKKWHLLQSITNKIRTLIINKLKYNSDSTLNADIIDIMKDIPIDVNGHNKRFYLNRLVSELMRKIKDIFTPSHSRRKWRKASDFSYEYIQPTEKELKMFIREEITEFARKFSLKVCPEILKQIEIELIAILVDSLDIIRLGNIEDVKEDILGMLADFISISEHQAIYFANNVIYNLKDMFDQSNCISMPRSQTFIILQSSLHNTMQEASKNNTNSSIEEITRDDIDANMDLYMKQIVQQIKEWSANIKGFDEIDSTFRQVVTNDLAGDIVDRHKFLELNPSSKKTDTDELEHLKYQIFKWINKVVGEHHLDTIERASELMERVRSVPVPMLTKLQQNNKPTPLCCRNATVPNIKPEEVQSTSKERRFSSPEQYTEQPGGTAVMTGKEFLNLNRRSGISIPKVSPNLIDSAQNETTESRFNASMGVTSTPKKNLPSATIQTRKSQPQGSIASMMEPPRDKVPHTNNRMSGPATYCSRPTKSINLRPDAANAEVAHETPSVKQLNDEYDEFVQNWVQQIPIATSSPEEQALAEKARLGIYNGIWKAITKLKMNPATMNNPFYYQDIFDDELEELLSLLPQTPELISKKPVLKAQLIEKTTNTNELIVSAAGPSSYKQQLIENVSNKLPRNIIDYTGIDIVKLYEEMQKMNLAEDFILYMNYREFDRVKANVFKKKLMKEVQELINGIKQNYGKDLKDIDLHIYKDEVIAALQNVPLPSEDTIREEAEEINIGLEIEQWFSDLPLAPNDDAVERLGRRRYKDALAKKIRDIEKQRSLDDCDKHVKEEVKRFLVRMPLRPGESENINFMVDELVNRLKNRPNDIIALGGERRKSVAFVDAYDYDDFSRDIPICSSFSDMGRSAQANRSSYMIADGTRVKNNDPYEQYVRQRDATPESQQQWYSLEETVVPPGLMSPGQVPMQGALPLCCQSHLKGPATIPQVQTSSLPITYSSASQTPNPSLKIHSHENLRDPRPYTQHSRTHSPGRFDQSPRYEQAPHRFSQGFQSFEHAPQRYEQRSQRFEQIPQRFEHGPSRLDYEPETHGTENGFDRQGSCAVCKSRRSSAPPSYRTEGTTRPMAAYTPNFQPNRRFSPKSTMPSAQFQDPIGFSTPQRDVSPPTSTRPKKKTRNVGQPRKDAAKKRLVLEDTEYESEEEMRCRCMEKVWSCRRKKPVCRDYDENDYLPCYVRFPPHPCFF